jgi:hypothetical protein
MLVGSWLFEFAGDYRQGVAWRTRLLRLPHGRTEVPEFSRE